MVTKYDFINQETVDSALIFAKDADSFFYPTQLGHLGFAANGIWHNYGVPDTSRLATWYSEGESETRGATPGFPSPALVLLSKASLSILDESVATLDLWMLFLLGDALALSNNFLGRTSGYAATSVTWANGLLSVVYTPDPGSIDRAALMLTIDFVHDRVFMDTSV